MADARLYASNLYFMPCVRPCIPYPARYKSDAFRHIFALANTHYSLKVKILRGSRFLMGVLEIG